MIEEHISFELILLNMNMNMEFMKSKKKHVNFQQLKPFFFRLACYILMLVQSMKTQSRTVTAEDSIDHRMQSKVTIFKDAYSII